MSNRYRNLSAEAIERELEVALSTNSSEAISLLLAELGRRKSRLARQLYQRWSEKMRLRSAVPDGASVVRSQIPDIAANDLSPDLKRTLADLEFALRNNELDERIESLGALAARGTTRAMMLETETSPQAEIPALQQLWNKLSSLRKLEATAERTSERISICESLEKIVEELGMPTQEHRLRLSDLRKRIQSDQLALADAKRRLSAARLQVDELQILVNKLTAKRAEDDQQELINDAASTAARVQTAIYALRDLDSEALTAMLRNPAGLDEDEVAAARHLLSRAGKYRSKSQS